MRYICLFLVLNIFPKLEAQTNYTSFSFLDTIVETGMTLNIEAIDYNTDQTKYNFDKNKIDSLAYFLNINPLVEIEIICNSDYTESPLMSMMATSEQAESLRLYLVKKGIKGTRINIYGNGEMNLLVSENDKTYMGREGRKNANKKNRRIEVTIVDIKQEKQKEPTRGLKSYPH